MTLLERIEDDLKNAMKSHDAGRVNILRLLRSSIQNAVIAARTSVKQTLTEDDVSTVVQQEVKKLKDALVDFTKAARNDLVETTKAEIQVLESYAPKQLHPDELKSIVSEQIARLKAEGKAEFGKVMQAVMDKVRGRADGQQVSATVKGELESDKQV